MSRFIEVFIDSAILWITAYYVGKQLLKPNSDVKIISIIINILIFSTLLGFINIINSEILHGIIKILTVYMLQCLYFKFTFKENFSKSMIIALIWYLSLCLSEVIIAIILSIILGIINQSLEFLKNTIFINTLIAVIEMFIVSMNKNILKSFLKNATINRKLNIIIIIVILIALSLLIFKIPISNWKLDPEFIVTMVILLCFCIIGIVIIKQNSDIQKTYYMYQQLAEYSNITNKVLEEYRMVNHEHKNQLSIIRQMTKKENKKLIEYLDNLLEKKNSIKYKWVTDLNNIPLNGLRGLINYKLLEMEENNINITVSISKDISKVKLEKLSTKQKDNLYSVVGVYLDNAIQAALESKNKEVSLEIYKIKKDIILVLGNTYTGEINIDKLDEYGYTTKGKNHGVGLHIVERIMNEERLLSQNRRIIDNYYMQELIIHTNEIKTNKVKK